MILGNVEAAKFLIQKNPENGLVIHHPAPKEISIRFFKENFDKLKISADFSNVFSLQKDLQRILDR